MSTDLSNNLTIESIINSTPSMESLEFLSFLLTGSLPTNSTTSTLRPQLRPRNFRNSPIIDVSNITTFNNLPNLDHLLSVADLSSSLQNRNSNSTDINELYADISNNIDNLSNNDANTDYYRRFLEDILHLPPIPGLVPSNHIRNLLRETLLGDKNPIKHTLSVEGEKTVKTVEFDPEIYPEITCCPITIKEFKKGDQISQLPCNHLFNTEAILKWLKEEKAECPICRFKLESKEEKLENNNTSTNTPPILPRQNIRLTHPFGPNMQPRSS